MSQIYLAISYYMYMLMMEWKDTIHEKYMVCSCQVVQIKLTTKCIILQIVQCGKVSRFWNSTVIHWKTFAVPYIYDIISRGPINIMIISQENFCSFLSVHDNCKTFNLKRFAKYIMPDIQYFMKR